MSIKAKMLELKNSRAGLIREAEEALEKGEMDAYNAKMAEVKGLNDQIAAAEGLVEEQERYGEPGKKAAEPQAADGQKALSGYQQAVKSLAGAARAGFKVSKAQGDSLSEGEAVDGGYTVPEDIVTKVEEFRDAKESLLGLVTRHRVSTNKGARTFKKRKANKGFSTVEEAAKLGKVAGPEFERLTWEIEKRGGYMAVTNELLEDSDENITNTVVEWLGDEARVTVNTEILNVIKAHAVTTLKSLDDIIKAWIGLGSVFRSSSAVITNDDGLLWLSTLKDQNGRYLLSPNPAEPHRLQLCAGPHTIPVRTFDNSTIPSEDTKIPFIIGDLKEGIVYWDRRQLTLMMSKTAVAGDFNAFEQDMSLWRGTMRDDCTERDKDAYVYGQLDTALGE